MAIGCRVARSEEHGIELLVLENEVIAATILSGKGADLYALQYKPLKIDPFLKTKGGLSLFKGRDLRSNRLSWYSELFAGGWMDVLPHRARCGTTEITQERSGIAATLPWRYEILEESQDRASVSFAVELPLVPLAVEKVASVAGGSPAVRFQERVRNIGDAPVSFTWTQHPTFGPPFLDEGVEVDLPPCIAFHPREYAMDRSGGIQAFEEPIDKVTVGDDRTRDLRLLRPKRENEELFVALTGLDRHTVSLANPALDLAVTLAWDADAFPYLRYWYRNRSGIYTLGLEPSNDCFANLDDSLRHGSYVELGPGETCSAWLSCTFSSGTGAR